MIDEAFDCKLMHTQKRLKLGKSDKKGTYDKQDIIKLSEMNSNERKQNIHSQNQESKTGRKICVIGLELN